MYRETKPLAETKTDALKEVYEEIERGLRGLAPLHQSQQVGQIEILLGVLKEGEYGTSSASSIGMSLRYIPIRETPSVADPS